MRWTWGLLLLGGLTGCDAITLEQLGPKTVTRTTAVPAGATCEYGGSKLESGQDWNRDGVLGDAEVGATEYLCDEPPPPVVVRRRPEPPGGHCELGGTAVQSGHDANGNGDLDDGEVLTTEYVCAQPPPDVLVTYAQLPPGETCPQGGQTIRAGTDEDGDGALSPGEVDREINACMEKAPFLMRAYAPWPQYGSCVNGTQMLVQAGVDLDEDRALDPDEVRASRYLCGQASKIRFAWKTTTASEHCSTEGFSVDAWVDENGDEQMAQGEPQIALHVCRGSTLYDGVYVVRGPADLAALRSITHLRGTLVVNSPDMEKLDLPSLWSIDGSLSIIRSPYLTSVALPALRYVGEDVEVFTNETLKDLNLGSHGPTPSHPVWVGGKVKLSDNAALTSLTGVTGLAPQKSFILTENASLEASIGLPYLESLSEELVVGANPKLLYLGFMALESVGGPARVYDNDSLTSLFGLRTLRTVGTELYIIGNDALEDTSGLEALTQVGGNFWVQENAALRSLALPSLRGFQDLLVEDNPQLESMGPLPSLSNPFRELRIARNAKLTRVTQAPGLQVAGTLTIARNPLLTDLSAFENVTRASHVELDQNDALPSLSGFKGLREAGWFKVILHDGLRTLDMGERLRVTAEFNVSYNPRLPTCAVDALADAAFTGDPDARFVEGNDDTATCSP
ncbi:hypothetical protein LY474_23125 [Myxococcus stipitatus]|uniref:DUF7151 family protein n=1 Tax=Myxococcus stipitatus TaxID=83455 RepID=UPI001F42F65F|nr:hypothetical protein [Myxococcus stipitatus]MCE9670704.1 hypothetical protein [Myxococcus stipitatus]